MPIIYRGIRVTHSTLRMTYTNNNELRFIAKPLNNKSCTEKIFMIRISPSILTISYYLSHKLPEDLK